MENPFAIMMIGKTHSGKTTLAREFAKKYESGKSCVVLDVDEIDLFAKKNYPELIEFEKTQREFYSKDSFTPFLKLKLQSTVFEYAVSTGFNVILSNGHIAQQGRDYQVVLAHKLEVPLIVIYLEVPDDILLERIKNSTKGTKMLTVSNTLKEMFAKQSSIFKPPISEDYEHFLKLDGTKPVNDNVNEFVSYLETIN